MTGRCSNKSSCGAAPAALLPLLLRTPALTAALAVVAIIACAAHPVPAETRLEAIDAARTELDTGWRLADSDDVPATGARVSLPDYDTSGWLDAVVPGTVLTALVEAGQYAEPLYGENIRDIPDLAALGKHYWYRVTFAVAAGRGDRRTWLHFDGINYKADLWLNGQFIDHMEGAFRRGIFDVTDTVNVGSNTLAVFIYPNENPGDRHDKTIADCCDNGGDLAQDSPTHLCTVGWDWIPTIPDRCMGIWQDVYVRETGPVTVRNPHITTDLPLPDTSPASLSVSAELVNATELAQNGYLRGRIGDTTFAQFVSLDPGEQLLVTFEPTEFTELVMTDPLPWWPNGYGEQNLYELQLWFEMSDTTVSDRTTERFGIRELSYEFSQLTPPELIVKVNGARIFCKGGNWGMDEALKRMSHQRYDDLLRLHRDANIVMIRNWVGMTDDPSFYEFCDEYGLLVWDEFWLANPWDGPDPSDPALFLLHAEDKIKRYRNHPCIALWCARNEGYAPVLIDSGLNALIDELDGTRRYQRLSDNEGVHGRGPWYYQHPASYYRSSGWGHAYGFTTEIGMPCVPSVESMRAMMPETDLWPIGQAWGFHDYCGGNGDPNVYTQAVNARYGDATGVEDFCRKAQLVNLETHKAIFEAWNHRMWRGPEYCSGVLLWMTNPCWPSTMWQLYDYYLEPTAAYFGVKSACEPLHIQMSLDDWTVSVVNNRLESFDALVAEARVFDLDGTESAESYWSYIVDVGANSVTDCFGLAFDPSLSTVHFVRLNLYDGAGELLSRNFYWRSSADPDFTLLDTMPDVDVSWSAALEPSDDDAVRSHIELHVENETPYVALMLRAKLVGAESGERLLPVFYEDNYFSLLPGESRDISVEIPSHALPDERPRIVLEGWNVTADANTLPVANGIADVVLDEDGERAVIDLTAAFEDAEDAAWQLTYAVAENSAPDIVRTSIGESALVLVPMPDAAGDATIRVTATDSAGGSTTDTFNVTVNPVNDAPVLTPVGPILATITDHDVDNPGASVEGILGNSVQDVDADAVVGIAVFGMNAPAGTWQYSFADGREWVVLGAVDQQNALLLRGTDRLRFVPAAHPDSTPGLDYVAWDRTSGAAGLWSDITDRGGTTAFSTEPDRVSQPVELSNYPPTIDLDSATPGTSFEALFEATSGPVAIAATTGLVVTDVDSELAHSATVAIVNPLDAPDEILDVDVADRQIKVHFEPSTGVLTLNGISSIETYQTVLRTVTYENSRAARTTAARTIEFIVSDGDADSTPAVATVSFRDRIQVELNTQWNLLSIPFATDSGVDLESLLCSDDGTVLFSGTLWAWDEACQRHVPIAAGLQAKRGFWAFGSVSTATLSNAFSGTADTASVLQLTRGWNLIGTAWRGVLQPSGIALNSVWTWDVDTQTYSSPERGHVLERGTGYWVYAVQDGDVDVVPDPGEEEAR